MSTEELTPARRAADYDRLRAENADLRATAKAHADQLAAANHTKSEAWAMLSGEVEKCPACGTGGYGALRDVLKYAERFAAPEEGK